MNNGQIIALIRDGSATSDWVPWSGGVGTFTVVGTFSGATITLQYQGGDLSTAIDVGPDVILTAEAMANFEVAPGLIRAEVVGGTPSGLFVMALGMGQ